MFQTQSGDDRDKVTDQRITWFGSTRLPDEEEMIGEYVKSGICIEDHAHLHRDVVRGAGKGPISGMTDSDSRPT